MFDLISKIVIATSLAIGSWFIPEAPTPVEPVIVQEQEAPALGAYNPSGGGTYRLKSSIGTTNTTITLSSFKEPVSEIPYTMTYLNTSVGYGTLDPQNTTRSEFVSFTGITQNADGSATLTGVTRGMSRSYPYTASSTLRQAHGGQSIFILSDSPQHFSEYAIKQNDETITGQWTFTNFPITASTSFASETVVGAVELSTGQEAASSTASGAGARLALPTSISTSTGGTAYTIPVTGSTGVLSEGFVPKTLTGDYNYTGSLSIDGTDITSTNIIHATTTPLEITNNTSGAYGSTTIPANTFGSNKGVRISGFLSDVDTPASSFSYLYMRIATTTCTLTYISPSVTNLSGNFEFTVYATSTNSQHLYGYSLLTTDTPKSSTASCSSFPTFNTAQDVTFVIGLVSPSSGTHLKIDRWIIEKI